MDKSTLDPREELSDLDWMARNVHEWPAGDHQLWCYVYMTHGGVMKAAGNFLDAVAKPTIITIYQWLASRADLQNKPRWEDAPEWAEWLAQDEDGEWKWLAGLPGKYVDSWTAVKIKGCCKGIALGDWRDTLEKRPADMSEQAVTARLKEATDNVLAAVPELMTDKYKFTPFTSIEDSQEKDMKQDNGWFERGDLPPVGCVCQFFSDGYDSDWFDWCIFHGLASCGGFIIEHHHRTSPEMVTVALFNPLLTKFRPIHTERDELVNVFINHYGNPKGAEGYIGIADAILAAGFKRDVGAA